jgi:superfamily II DNA or RNA helicase
MIQLRDFQQDVERRIYAAWQDGARNVLAVMPTGSGKTVLFSKIMADQSRPSVAIAHRQELVGQISLALARNGVRHRIIGPRSVARACASLHLAETRRNYIDPTSPRAVAGVDTLVRMPAEPWMSQIGLWVNDECHHQLRENKWGKAAAMFPNAFGLGVTATPCRADGRGMGRHADGLIDAMVVGLPMRALIDDGWLSEYRVFVPPSDLHLEDVAISAGGDYSPVPLRAAVHKSHITGDVVAHYQRIAPGKLGVTFAVDVAAATEIAAAFRAAEVPAEVVSADTPDALRSHVLRRFRSREVLQLVNVDLFGEGFDLPALEVVSMARPTQSYALYAQQFGRALRILDGKDCVARGTLILTDKGEVPIEQLTLDHRVWDGVNFVTHGGAVCKGVRPTITYDGITATPDHEVMTNVGWKTLEQAKGRYRIIISGFDGVPVRVFSNCRPSNDGDELQFASTGNVRAMRSHAHGAVPQHEETPEYERLPVVQSPTKTRGGPFLAISKVPRAAAKVLQSIKRGVSQLWRARHSIPVSNSLARGRVDSLDTGFAEKSKVADRQDRQQRALRTRKFAVGFAGSKCKQLAEAFCNAVFIQGLQRKIPRSSIRRQNLAENASRTFGGGDNRTVENALLQAEREVWDIYNAGPLRRFTANGKLVHNCAIIIDHVGNILRHGLPDAPRVWTLDRRERRSRGVSDLPPLRVCLSCTGAYDRVLAACPYCGEAWVPAERSTPAQVDGDLSELSPEALQRLRGEIDRPLVVPYGAPPEVVGAVRRNHRERQEAQAALRQSMAEWAGRHSTATDAGTVSALQRRFYLEHGIDVLSAQALGRREADELRGRIV